MFTQITVGNILSYPILFLQIFFLVPVYSLELSSSAQIIHCNILFYLSIFHLHKGYNIEYSVLPHIIPEKIIPFPDYRREYFDSAQYILYSNRLH